MALKLLSILLLPVLLVHGKNTPCVPKTVTHVRTVTDLQTVTHTHTATHIEKEIVQLYSIITHTATSTSIVRDFVPTTIHATSISTTTLVSTKVSMFNTCSSTKPSTATTIRTTVTSASTKTGGTTTRASSISASVATPSPTSSSSCINGVVKEGSQEYDFYCSATVVKGTIYGSSPQGNVTTCMDWCNLYPAATCAAVTFDASKQQSCTMYSLVEAYSPSTSGGIYFALRSSAEATTSSLTSSASSTSITPTSPNMNVSTVSTTSLTHSSTSTTPSSTPTTLSCPSNYTAGALTENGSNYTLSCATSAIATNDTLSMGPAKTLDDCFSMCDSLGDRCQALSWSPSPYGYCTTYQWAMTTTNDTSGAAYAERSGALPLADFTVYAPTACTPAFNATPSSFNLYAAGSQNTTYDNNTWCMNAVSWDSTNANAGLEVYLNPASSGCASFSFNASSNSLYTTNSTLPMSSNNNAAYVVEYGFTSTLFYAYNTYPVSCEVVGCYLECSAFSTTNTWCQVEHSGQAPGSGQTLLVPQNYTTYVEQDNSYVCDPFSLAIVPISGS